MSDFAQTVKQQADIVKVIEGYIRLRKAGAQRFTGLCPFHKEKTPSFSVHAGQQFFYCFGCQATGDVFSFVGKIENVGFPEAVRIVAQKCGIPLPKREFSSPEEAAGARLRTKLLELHETAAAWFEEQLRSPGGALAREYLAGRGLTDEGIRRFRIGYAPDSYNALRDRLSGMADEATLRASGLFSSKEQGDGSQGPIYDRFRKRVMFPICERGREGDCVYGADARDRREGRGQVHQFAGDATLYEGPGAVQPGQGKVGDPRAGVCAAGGGTDGLHQRVSGGNSERDCDQRDGVHRAAGGDFEAAHFECDRELRSRCGGRECGGEVDRAADRGGILRSRL